MPDEAKSTSPIYEDVPSAPIVYFDGIAANGIMGGAIQVELAHRVLIPSGNSEVTAKFQTSGRIRCSPHAARELIGALQQALTMLEQSQQPAAAATKLN